MKESEANQRFDTLMCGSAHRTELVPQFVPCNLGLVNRMQQVSGVATHQCPGSAVVQNNISMKVEMDVHVLVSVDRTTRGMACRPSVNAGYIENAWQAQDQRLSVCRFGVNGARFEALSGVIIELLLTIRNPARIDSMTSGRVCARPDTNIGCARGPRR